MEYSKQEVEEMLWFLLEQPYDGYYTQVYEGEYRGDARALLQDAVTYVNHSTNRIRGNAYPPDLEDILVEFFGQWM